MKTSLKPLLIAFSLCFVSLSTAWAEGNPIGQPTTVATYKTAIYPTLNGQISIALDKLKGRPLVIRLKNSTGQTCFVQQLSRNDQTYRTRLDVSDLPDGEYQVVITDGVGLTVHLLRLSTPPPTKAATRLVAIN